MEEFRERTLEKRNFEIIEVNGDGLCLYRSMIRFLVDYQKELNHHNCFYKIFNDPNIKEIGASINLQIILKDWILEHKDDLLDSSLPIEGTISYLVMIDHGEYIDSIETYGDLYSIPANDISIFNNEESGEAIFIPTRWGGITEIYAFSKIFELNVYQWSCKRWNVIKGEVENCDGKDRGGRFKIIQQIQKEDQKLIFDVLYADYGFQSRHYSYLRNKKQFSQMKQKMKGFKEKSRREERENKNGDSRDKEERKEEDCETS